MDWNPCWPEDPNLAVLATTVNRLPLIAQFIARRVTENLRAVPEPVNALVVLAKCADQRTSAAGPF